MLLARWIRLSACAMVASCALAGPAQAQVFIWGGQRDGLGAWGGATPGSGSPRYGGGWGGYGYGGWGGYGYTGFYGQRGLGSPGMTYSTFTVAGWTVGPGRGLAAAAGPIRGAVAVQADSPMLVVAADGVAVPARSSCSRFVIQVPKCASGCARIWVDGKLVCEKESVYRFETTALDSGRYVYEFRAQWTNQAGQQRTVTKNVTFQTGEVVPVDFTE